MAINNMNAEPATIRTDRPVSNLQQLAKRRDNVPLDAVGDTLKDGTDRRLLSGSISDEYCNGQIAIHFHALARIYVDTPVAGDFCLLFNAVTEGPFKKILSHVRRDRRSRALMRTNGNEQSTMLVDVFQFLKYPERMRCGLIPSVIRLQSLNDCLRLSADMLDFAHTPTLESRAGLKNGESGFGRFRVRQGRFVLEGKGVNQMVKSSHGNCGDNRPTFGR